MLGQRCIRRYRLVTGEDAAPEKALALRCSRKLIVAVQIAVANALLELLGDGRRLSDHDDAPNLDARPKPELDPRDDAKQSVPPNRQTKQLRVLAPRTGPHFAVRAQ